MEANRRKTLHPAYRVTDLDMSLGFYTALGCGLSGVREHRSPSRRDGWPSGRSRSIRSWSR
jgi:catechol 2,3-dioxygenase-like lactoylglutathione lyase family enzyme